MKTRIGHYFQLAENGTDFKTEIIGGLTAFLVVGKRKGALIAGICLTTLLATAISGLLGSSPGTSYIESAAGIEEGGRTGLTAVVPGCFFCR